MFLITDGQSTLIKDLPENEIEDWKFAEKIYTLITDKKLRYKYVETGKKYAQKFKVSPANDCWKLLLYVLVISIIHSPIEQILVFNIDS